MTRLHIHVRVDDLGRAIGFYSGLFGARPCCSGARFANWRIDEPPVNFAVAAGPGPRGALHLGLEVERPTDLKPIDRVLRGALRVHGGLPWEVSVGKPQVQQETAR